MSGDRLEIARKRLEDELAEIEAGDELSSDARRTVELDQQSVGRLSRMDALQNQAMAQATSRRRSARRQRILAALCRLDEGEFGYCTECGEEIPRGRLALDPTHPTCVTCVDR